MQIVQLVTIQIWRIDLQAPPALAEFWKFEILRANWGLNLKFREWMTTYIGNGTGDGERTSDAHVDVWGAD